MLEVRDLDNTHGSRLLASIGPSTRFFHRLHFLSELIAGALSGSPI
jgi:hypothetical protein